MAMASKIGLRGVAAKAQKSELNVFIGLNHQCVSVADGEVAIDYASVRVSAGDLPAVTFGTPQLTGDTHVSVGFTRAGTAYGGYNDYVYLFAYCPSLREGFLSQPAKRCSGHVADTLPGRWTGRAAHFYGFAWDTALSASDSTYLGTILIP